MQQYKGSLLFFVTSLSHHFVTKVYVYIYIYIYLFCFLPGYIFFIGVELELFPFGGWEVQPAESHQPFRLHASFELCFWTQVKDDNCEFHNFF